MPTRLHLEMAISRLFSRLDCIWASHGISCLPFKSASKRRVLCAIRISTHLFIIQHLIGISTNVIVTGDLRNILMVIYVSCCYMAYFIMAYKLEGAVNEIATYGNRFLTVKVRRHLLKIELYAAIGYIIWFTIYFLTYVVNHASTAFGSSNETENFDRLNYWIAVPKESITLTMIYNSVFCSLIVHMTDAMNIGAAFVYCYLAFVINSIQSSFIDCVSKRKMTIKELRIVWREVISVKDSLEGNLNAIPLLAMAILFQNAVTLVLVFSHDDSKSSPDNSGSRAVQLATYWAFEVGIAIPILVMPFLVSWIDKNMRSRFTSLQKRVIIIYARHDPEFEVLMDEIRSNLDFGLTGYGMFRLEKELVLPFLSSIVSFSVLFMQLTNS